MTYAGNGMSGNSGDGGIATLAKISLPIGGAVDKYGNYYFTTGSIGNSVRKVDTAGIITTVAGQGTGGDGGPAYTAELQNPQAVTVDTLGNLYIAETGRNKIRKINATSGIISTVAGNGTAGFFGDSGVASNALISYPLDLCFDSNGNLYIADAGNSRVRKISTTGIITTVAGNGSNGYSGDGGHADTSAIGPVQGICVDPYANLYIASEQNRLYKANALTGIITTYAGDGTFGSTGDSGLAINALVDPFKVTCDKAGNIFIADRGNEEVRMVNGNGIILPIAGTGAGGYNGDSIAAISAQLYKPAGVVTDYCGNLYIADAYNNRIRKVTFHPNCFPESVKNVNKENEVNIYPNPAEEQLTIACGSGIKELRVMNTIGQVLIEQKNYTEKAIVNVSGLNSGVYFIQMSGKDGRVVTRRFVKE